MREGKKEERGFLTTTEKGFLTGCQKKKPLWTGRGEKEKKREGKGKGRSGQGKASSSLNAGQKKGSIE